MSSSINSVASAGTSSENDIEKQIPSINTDPTHVNQSMVKGDCDDSGWDDEFAASSGREEPKEEDIAGYEDKLVGYSKVLVITVLGFFAISMGHIAFLFVRGKEQQDMVKNFQQASMELTRLSHRNALGIFEKMATLSAAITFEAQSQVDHNTTGTSPISWPFVVIPEFPNYAQSLVADTGLPGPGPVSTLAMHPLVSDNDRQAWEEFSQYTHYEWMLKSHQYENQVNHLEQDQTEGQGSSAREPWNNVGVPPHIWTTGNATDSWAVKRHYEPSPQATRYFPFWQHMPPADFESLINLDVSDQPLFVDAIDDMMAHHRPVLTDWTKESDTTTRFWSHPYRTSRFSPPTVLQEPHMYLLQPVYDRLDTDADANTSTASSHNRTSVVAFLSAFLRLGVFFDTILASYNGKGIMLVTRSSCSPDQPFTYLLRQGSGEFLGHGDLHTKLVGSVGSKMGVPQFDIDIDTVSSTKMNHTGTPNLGCRYTAQIYPSQEWQDDYYTEYPFYYALAAVGCFSLSCLLFVFYDGHVDARQKALMDNATRSNAIVNNLFPAQVKKTLMSEAIKADKKNEDPWGMVSGGLSSDASNRRDLSMSEKNERETKKLFGSDPIAELFPESTIMFADLAGFTAWSSTRTPTDVFMLLEHLYHAFDQIARRRKVFKVETIGDCYVAVCGVPSPNKNHALVMARFATDCLRKMQELVSGELARKLGEDTSTLVLRTGLHSGPVTAGVLRGDRGRFQLFGDSINTASRMESTGVKGRVQISATTAALLAESGKENWTKIREDPVHAKGKGVLTTYWLEIPSASDSNQSTGGSTSFSVGPGDGAAADQENHPFSPSGGEGEDDNNGNDTTALGGNEC